MLGTEPDPPVWILHSDPPVWIVHSGTEPGPPVWTLSGTEPGPPVWILGRADRPRQSPPVWLFFKVVGERIVPDSRHQCGFLGERIVPDSRQRDTVQAQSPSHQCGCLGERIIPDTIPLQKGESHQDPRAKSQQCSLAELVAPPQRRRSRQASAKPWSEWKVFDTFHQTP